MSAPERWAKNMSNRFPECVAALILTAIFGLLVSLIFSGGRLTQKQKSRRVVILQTIPVWGPASTYPLIGMVAWALSFLPQQILNALK